MEPIDFVKVLRRRWLIIVLSVLVALAAAWATMPDKQDIGPGVTSYTGTATLLPISNDPLAQTAGIFPDLTLFLTKGEVPRRVAEQVGYSGDPAVLGSSVTVVNDETTGAVDITLTGDSAEVAKTANVFAEEIIVFLEETNAEERARQQKQLEVGVNTALEGLDEAQQAADDSPNDTLLQLQAEAAQEAYRAVSTDYLTFLAQEATGTPKLQVLQEATPIPTASSTGFTAPTSRTGRLLLALAVGLLVGILLALATERFDTRLRSRQSIQDAYRLPVVAEVPRSRRLIGGANSIATLTSPVSPVAESYRSLRSALTLLPSRPPSSGNWASPRISTGDELALETRSPQVVLISSARSGEGKTTTAANLAIALAETGKQVLMLDADFRYPRLSRLFEIPAGPGLADLLSVADSVDLASLARPTKVNGVRLIAAGNAQDYHGTLPSRIREVIAQARLVADIVIVDSAPLLSGNEAMDVMPYVDSVIMVARMGRVIQDHAERSADLLARAHAPTLGVVLVGVTNSGVLTRSSRGYGYYSPSPTPHRKRAKKAKAGRGAR